MDTLSRQPGRLRRAVGFCIAVLCLWMATAGVLCHTDDFQFGASSSHRAVWSRAGVAPTPADACAACQWLAGVQTYALLLFMLLPALFALPPRQAAAIRFQSRRPREASGTRGPPFLTLSLRRA